MSYINYYSAAVIVIFILLSTSCTTIQCLSSGWFYIVTSADSPCPMEEYAGDNLEWPCLTLQQYASNDSFSSDHINVTLQLEPGNHSLNSELSHSNLISFVMRSENAFIFCNQQDGAQLRIHSVQRVDIIGINFIACGYSEVNDVIHLLSKILVFKLC